MDTSFGSQKLIRKVLRSRQLSIPLMTKVVKPKKLFQKPTIVTYEEIKPKESSSPMEHDINEDDVKNSKIEEVKAYKSKMNVCKPTETKKGFTHCTKKMKGNEYGVLENSFDSNANDNSSIAPGLGHHVEQKHHNADHYGRLDKEHELQDEEYEEQNEEQEHQDQFEDSQFGNDGDGEDQNFQNSSDDIDGQTLTENCVESVLKGFSKDIGALYSKTNGLESEVKDMKRLIKARPSNHCTCRALSSQFKQKSSFSLLPKLPLLKRKHVRKMASDIDENEEYKEQIINKMASFGGGSVQEIMINIFKKLFSSKLKTKYCWRGSIKGDGKAAFKELTSIIEVLWSAVKVHYESCTEATIKKEIKLRLNQAKKDFNREMEKLQKRNMQ